MTEHQWVKMQYTPIQAGYDELANDVLVMIDESARKVAEESATLACWHCHTPLNIHTLATECVPEPAEGQIATGP